MLLTGKNLSLAGALLALSLCPASSSAQSASSRTATDNQQQPASRPGAQTSSKDVSPDSADLAITATVTAKELRFDVVPNPTVKFTGEPERDTVWDAVRENLPRPVQPGVTYRDIGIRLKIVSRFADIERIVAEALGETPVTDSVPTQENAQPSAQPPASTTKPNGGRP